MSLVVKIPKLHAFALKCCALLFGYSLWHSISMPYKIETTLQLPLSFYNTEHYSLQAPESIGVKVYGPRKELFKAAHHASIHYDAATLHEGTQTITLSSEHIFLPETVSLLHSRVTKVTITTIPTSSLT